MLSVRRLNGRLGRSRGRGSFGSYSRSRSGISSVGSGRSRREILGLVRLVVVRRRVRPGRRKSNVGDEFLCRLIKS